MSSTILKKFIWPPVKDGCYDDDDIAEATASSEEQAIQMILPKFKKDLSGRLGMKMIEELDKELLFKEKEKLSTILSYLNTFDTQVNCFEKELRSRKPLVCGLTESVVYFS